VEEDDLEMILLVPIDDMTVLSYTDTYYPYIPCLSQPSLAPWPVDPKRV
jgi:hypothetical protein